MRLVVLALAWVALAAAARAQEPAPEARPPELPPEAAASLPGLDRERARLLSEALRSRAYARAEALLVETAQREPAPPEVLRLLGRVSFLAGNYLNAAIALKKAEARAPLDEGSRFTLAMAYVLMGRREWARPELRRLAQEAPANALYPYWTGRLDYDAALYVEAARALQAAVAADPGFVKAHDNLGLCYEALGRFDEAVASADTAVRLNRGAELPSPWPPHNLGLLLTRLGRADDAGALFREALRYDASFAPAHYQLGLALERSGQAAEALAALGEAARLDPAYPDPHYALSRALRRQGRTAEADRALALFQRLKKEKEAGSAAR